MVSVGLFFFRLSSSGGAERMICWLANALVSHGYSVCLFSLDDPGVSSFYELDPEVNWIKLGIRGGFGDKIRRTRLLVRYLKQYRIKTLIGFVISGDKTVYVAAKLAKTMLIVAERNAPSMYDIRYSPCQKRMFFFMMRFAERVTVQSARFISSYPPRLQQKIVAIPNPVLPALQYATPDLADNRGRYILLAVSRLDEIQKSLSCLIDAFALIAEGHPNWELHIIGGGPDEHLYQELITKYALQARITLVKEQTNINDYYVQSHLFVMPSRWEGFPNALAEAMASGLPAIGFSEASGVADLISDNTGWLVPGISDKNELAQVLTIAMAAPEKRKQKGLEAIKFMEQFSPEVQIKRWITLINELGNK